MPPELFGKRVLVAEDEILVAMLLELILADAGCTVIGPFGRVSDALDALATETVDVALLDVDLSGEKVFPVADALSGRNVPFLFVTGYGRSALPKDHQDWEAVSKPFVPEQLAERLARKVRAQSSSNPADGAAAF